MKKEMQWEDIDYGKLGKYFLLAIVLGTIFMVVMANVNAEPIVLLTFNDGTATTNDGTQFIDATDFSTTQNSTYPTYNNTGNGTPYSRGFADTDRYILFNNESVLNLTGNFTVSSWIYSNGVLSLGNNMAIIGNSNGDTGDGWRIIENVLNKVRYEQKDNMGTFQGVSGFISIVDNQWTFITVRKQENGTVSIYVNGILDTDQSISSNPIQYLNTPTSNVGKLSNLYWQMYGTLDNVRVDNVYLTDTQIANLYNYGDIVSPNAIKNITFTNSVIYQSAPQTNDTIMFNITITSVDATNIDSYIFSYYDSNIVQWVNTTVSVNSPSVLASQNAFVADLDWFNWTWYANLTINNTIYQSQLFAVHVNDVFPPTIFVVPDDFTPEPNQTIHFAGYAENNRALDKCWIYNNKTNNDSNLIQLTGRVASCFYNFSAVTDNGTTINFVFYVNDSSGLVGNGSINLTYLSPTITPPSTSWTPTGNFIYDFVFGYGDSFIGQAVATIAVTLGVLLILGIELMKFAKKK